MKKIFSTLFLIGLTMGLPGCSSPVVEDYSDTTPVINLRDYFSGPIKAWGVVQDRSGKVVSRFDVVMKGSWEGDVGTLKEDFTYYDGKKQQRTWTIRKLADGAYQGEAGDIIDKAEGQTRGSAVHWHYSMDVPVEETTYRLKFDDWMWLMHDGVLINRSYLKKFGVTVAELTLVMQKQ